MIWKNWWNGAAALLTLLVLFSCSISGEESESLEPPVNLNCVSNNWNDLNCTWCPSDLNWTVTWELSNYYRNPEACHVQYSQCHCYICGNFWETFEECENYSGFSRDYIVTLRLRASSREDVYNYSINPREKIKPNPARRFTAGAIGSRTVQLSWARPLLLPDIVHLKYFVSYNSDWPNDSKIITFGPDVETGSLTDLTPYTNYTVSICSQPEIGGFCGDEVQIVILTAEDAPDSAPENRGFRSIPCLGKTANRDCWRIVTLYWKNILAQRRNGILINCKLTVVGTSESTSNYSVQYSDCLDVNRTNVTLPTEGNYVAKLVMSTEVGASPAAEWQLVNLDNVPNPVRDVNTKVYPKPAVKWKEPSPWKSPANVNKPLEGLKYVIWAHWLGGNKSWTAQYPDHEKEITIDCVDGGPVDVNISMTAISAQGGVSSLTYDAQNPIKFCLKGDVPVWKVAVPIAIVCGLVVILLAVLTTYVVRRLRRWAQLKPEWPAEPTISPEWFREQEQREDHYEAYGEAEQHGQREHSTDTSGPSEKRPLITMISKVSDDSGVYGSPEQGPTAHGSPECVSSGADTPACFTCMNTSVSERNSKRLPTGNDLECYHLTSKTSADRAMGVYSTVIDNDDGYRPTNKQFQRITLPNELPRSLEDSGVLQRSSATREPQENSTRGNSEVYSRVISNDDGYRPTNKQFQTLSLPHELPRSHEDSGVQSSSTAGQTQSTRGNGAGSRAGEGDRAAQEDPEMTTGDTDGYMRAHKTFCPEHYLEVHPDVQHGSSLKGTDISEASREGIRRLRSNDSNRQGESNAAMLEEAANAL